MWAVLNGTVVNVATVACGSAIGLLMSRRIPDRYQRIILDCLGLVTISLGVHASVVVMGETVQRYGAGIQTYGARLAMVMVAALLLGAVIGTALGLHRRIEKLGQVILLALPVEAWAPIGGSPDQSGFRISYSVVITPKGGPKWP